MTVPAKVTVVECLCVGEEHSTEHNAEHTLTLLLKELREINDRLTSIDADVASLHEDVTRAKLAVQKSKNPIIRGLFPWL